MLQNGHIILKSNLTKWAKARFSPCIAYCLYQFYYTNSLFTATDFSLTLVTLKVLTHPIGTYTQHTPHPLWNAHAGCAKLAPGRQGSRGLPRTPAHPHNASTPAHSHPTRTVSIPTPTQHPRALTQHIHQHHPAHPTITRQSHTHMITKDLTNKRIGNVTILRRTDNQHVKVLSAGVEFTPKPTWLCRCDCQRTFEVPQSRITDFSPKQCPHCARNARIKTGSNQYTTPRRHTSRHPSYSSWKAMLRRCYDESHDNYHRYGGAGITVCDRWRESFDNFVDDMGARPEGLTLDRIDNDQHYTPTNCKWSTPKEQANNRRKR